MLGYGYGGNKLLAIIPILFVGAICLCVYMSEIDGESYHKEFINDTFKKMEIKMVYNAIPDEEVKVTITDADEIKFFHDIFSNNFEYGGTKERKLYDFSIFLKFHNEDDTNIYVYKVYLDKGEIKLRPVGLREKDNSSKPGGYLFILKDPEFKFYHKMMEIWETREDPTTIIFGDDN